MATQDYLIVLTQQWMTGVGAKDLLRIAKVAGVATCSKGCAQELRDRAVDVIRRHPHLRAVFVRCVASIPRCPSAWLDRHTRQLIAPDDEFAAVWQSARGPHHSTTPSPFKPTTPLRDASLYVDCPTAAVDFQQSPSIDQSADQTAASIADFDVHHELPEGSAAARVLPAPVTTTTRVTATVFAPVSVRSTDHAGHSMISNAVAPACLLSPPFLHAINPQFVPAVFSPGCWSTTAVIWGPFVISKGTKHVNVDFELVREQIAANRGQRVDMNMVTGDSTVGTWPKNTTVIMNTICHEQVSVDTAFERTIARGLNRATISFACPTAADAVLVLRVRRRIATVRELIQTHSAREQLETCVARLDRILRHGNPGAGDQHHAGDDDVSFVGQASVTIPLTDPITLMRMVVPVRSNTCAHPHCFDMDTLVEFDAKRLEHGCAKCPICRRPLDVHALVVDRFVQHILESTDADCARVSYVGGGAFHVRDACADATADGSRGQPKRSRVVDMVVDSPRARRRVQAATISVVAIGAGAAWAPTQPLLVMLAQDE